MAASTPATGSTTPPAVDTRDMVMAHRAFRREFRLAPAAVRRTDTAQHARRVARHVASLVSALHHHHEAEDELLWPLLHARVPSELDALVDTMETQHEEVARLLHAVEQQLPAWSADPADAATEHLAGTLEELSRVLDEHLDLEEARLLPLAAAHLSPAEWAQLEERGMGSLPKAQAPVLVGMLLHEGDPEVLAGMIGRMPLLPRLLLPRVAPRAYARRARAIHGTATP